MKIFIFLSESPLKVRKIAIYHFLTLFHIGGGGGGGGGSDSSLLQIVFFISSVRDAAVSRNLMTFPTNNKIKQTILYST